MTATFLERARLGHVGERGDQLFEFGRGSARLRKIIACLEAQPEVRGAADRLFQPDRDISRDAALAADDAVKLLAGDPKAAGCLDRNRGAGFRLLVVVHEIDIKGVAVNEPEDDAPIGSDGECMQAFEIALEGVESVGR